MVLFKRTILGYTPVSDTPSFVILNWLRSPIISQYPLEVALGNPWKSSMNGGCWERIISNRGISRCHVWLRVISHPMDPWPLSEKLRLTPESSHHTPVTLPEATAGSKRNGTLVFSIPSVRWKINIFETTNQSQSPTINPRFSPGGRLTTAVTAVGPAASRRTRQPRGGRELAATVGNGGDRPGVISGALQKNIYIWASYTMAMLNNQMVFVYQCI